MKLYFGKFVHSLYLGLVIAACTSTPFNSNDETHWLCEAMCYHRKPQGSMERMTIFQKHRDKTMAWKNMQYQCKDLTCPGCTLADLEVPVTTYDKDGYPLHGMRQATPTQDCRRILLLESSDS